MTTQEHKIAVLIPLYNTEKYIEECLQSLAAQTYGNFHCFVINDGSTDNSRQVVEDFIARHQDKRFTLINKENEGAASARNLGLELIEQSGTQFFGICMPDSDDILFPEFLALLHTALMDSGADYAQCGIFDWYADQELPHTSLQIVSKLVQHDQLAHQFYADEWFGVKGYHYRGVSNILFRADILKGHRFNIRLKNFEDHSFYLELFPTIKRAVLINNPLYAYRARNTSSSHHNRKLQISKAEADCLLKTYKDSHTELPLRKALLPTLFRTLDEGMRHAAADSNNELFEFFFINLRQIYQENPHSAPKSLLSRLKRLKFGKLLNRVYLKSRMKRHNRKQSGASSRQYFE